MERKKHLNIAEPKGFRADQIDVPELLGVMSGLEGASDGSEGELLQVGDLARAAGKTVRAIHLYEELGLLEPAKRSKGQFRLFAKDALVRVRWIGKLQSLGFSLTEIKKVVAARDASPNALGAAGELRELYRVKLAEVSDKLTELRGLENELRASLDYLESCTTVCEEALGADSCSSCNRHEGDRAPELVAGANVH